MTMTNILSDFTKGQLEGVKKTRGFEIPTFDSGDTVNVQYKITEGGASRIQSFSGVVIAKSKNLSSYNSTFTVRKISSGVGVERKFITYSPLLAGVEVLKKGVTRRAKLYYLRNLAGKSARIKEKLIVEDSNSSAN
jgi:large subunit ribosomal protein L19